jgi:DNA-directed RNA polymerase subunit M/transcription elongation factor TFIIS
MNNERLEIQAAMRAVAAKNASWASLSAGDQDSAIRRMERSCFNANIESCTADGIYLSVSDPTYVARYSAICYRVISNADPDVVGDSHLIDAIVNFMEHGAVAGAINPADVAQMLSMDLCPSANKAVRDAIAERKNQKTTKKVSTKYVCKKCGSNSTIPLEFQGRSADEASTISIKCVYCGHIWR